MKIDKRLVCTTLSCVGVVATGVAVAHDTKKAERLIDKDKEYSKLELVKLYSKTYWLSLVIGGCTMASIIISHKLSSKEIAALTATATYLAYNRDALEHKLEEVVGKEKLDEIKHTIEEHYATNKTCGQFKSDVTIERSKYGGDTLFLDGYSGRLFYCTLERVEYAEKELNRMFTEDGAYICMNNFYELLGIQQTQFGDQYGWPANDDWYDLNNGIIFNNWFLSNGTAEHEGPLYAIEFFDHNSYPMECWKEL